MPRIACMPFVFLGTLLGCGDSTTPVEFTECAANVDNTVSLQAERDTGVADGSAVMFVSVKVPPATVAVPRALTLSTSSGTFVGSAAPATFSGLPDFCGHAIALLKSPRTEGPAILSLSFANRIAFDTVTFVRAWPDSVLVLADASTISEQDTIGVTLTIRLFRKRGIPSPGTLVRFRALGPANDSVGTFRPPVLFLDTLGTSKFVAGAGLKDKVITISAIVDTIGGQVVGRSTLLVVK